jgi:hypothetical protein
MGMGKDEGPPVASSRLMSSKCDRFSVVPMKSKSVDEWMLDDLLDLEFVKSGGLSGGAPKADCECASCEYVRVAMSGRGGLLGEETRNGVPMR